MKTLVRNLRVMVFGGVTAYRALFNWTSPTMFVTTLLISPFFQLVFFVFLGRYAGVRDDAFFLLGNSVLTCSMASLFGGTMAVSNERRYGTLGIVLCSGANRTAIFLGRGLPYVVNGLVVSAFTLAAGSAIFGIPVRSSQLGLLLLTLLVAAASGSAFGLALGAIGLRARDVFVVSNLAYYALTILSGANVPLDRLPSWLRDVSAILPLTHATQAARFLRGATGAPGFGRALGLELAAAAAYALIAVLLLRVFEHSSRRNASLETV